MTLLFQGRYSLGDLIVPQQYQTISLDDEEMKLSQFEVSGNPICKTLAN